MRGCSWLFLLFFVLGAMAAPVQAVTVRTGDVVVVDADDDEILHLDPATGTFTPVASGGELSLPAGIDVDGRGRIIVTDLATGVIRIDPATGAQTVLLDADPGGPVLYGPLDVVVAPGCLYVVSDAFEGVIEVNSTDASVSPIASGTHLISPTGIALDDLGQLLVVTEESAEDLTDDCFTEEAPALVRVNPQTGDQEIVSCSGDIIQPTGIAFEAGGTALVSDLVSGLVRIDLDTGAQTRLDAGNSLGATTNVALNALGEILATDETADAVVRLSAAGTELESFTDVRLGRPFALAVVPEPGGFVLPLASLSVLALLRRRALGARVLA